MTDWDLLLTDARLATMQPATSEYGAITDGAIAIRDGVIAWLGKAGQMPRASAAERNNFV